jgi:1,4-dihydroxy-2-naphthoyl-CoA hydrolase
VEGPAIVRRMALNSEPIAGFDGFYGLQLTRADGEGVDGHVTIAPQHLQPFGIVHGGVYASMAEAMASMGTYVGVGDGKFVAGMSNHTTFLRPAREGTIHAEARPLHTGRTTWIWDVTVRGDDGRPVASSRVTIAVRDAR